MSGGSFELETESLTRLHWVGVVLAVLTGLSHLVLAALFLPEPFGIVFLLAGLGFFGGVALLLLNVRRRLLYRVGVVYTLVQIVAYFPANADYLDPLLGWPAADPLGFADKVVQVALVVVLIQLIRKE